MSQWELPVEKFRFWRKTNCEEHSHCQIFADETAIRGEKVINDFDVPDPSLSDPLEVFANIKAPYCVTYFNKVIYIFMDEQCSLDDEEVVI